MINIPLVRGLGLTIETVLHTMTHLEKGAGIAVPTSRRVVLRNRSALNRINAESGIRGNAQDQTGSVHAPVRAAPAYFSSPSRHISKVAGGRLVVKQ
jgi:hypothetical protein